MRQNLVAKLRMSKLFAQKKVQFWINFIITSHVYKHIEFLYLVPLYFFC